MSGMKYKLMLVFLFCSFDSSGKLLSHNTAWLALSLVSKGNGGPEVCTGFQGKRGRGISPYVAVQCHGGSYFRGKRFQVEVLRRKVETPEVGLWLQHMCTCPRVWCCTHPSPRHTYTERSSRQQTLSIVLSRSASRR